MSPLGPLCTLPPPPPAGCCDPPPAPPAAPIRPDNVPGLAAIRYRIGTFSTFRRALLDALAGPPKPPPFAAWHEGTDGDYLTTLVELWAYLADILTFYQERIANEAYLPTATQRDSLFRLARLIDYRPGPGSGASVLLTFTVEKGKTIVVPAGFRAGSKPVPGQPPAVFETDAALNARGPYSAVPLSSVAPTNQFAKLDDYGVLLTPHLTQIDLVARAASAIYGDVGAFFLKTLANNLLPEALGVVEAHQAISARATSFAPAAFQAGPVPQGGPVSQSVSQASRIEIIRRPPILGFTGRFSWGSATRVVVLKGTALRLSAGDILLVVENEAQANENPTIHRLVAVATDKATDTTTVTWTEDAGVSYENVTLHALRVAAGPFGSNAPAWNTLSPTLTNSDGKTPGAPYADNWDNSNKSSYYVPGGTTLFLDGVYADVKGTATNPGWAALVSDGGMEIYHITDARTVSHTAYTITAKVTRLTLRETVPGSSFPLRGTTILTGDQPLTLQNSLPLPDPLSGQVLILSGLYPDLKKGQTVVLRGNLFDPQTQQASEVVQAESAILDGDPMLDSTNGLTTVTLHRPLSGQYARAGAVLLANVVAASQGETVKDEVLGSGNGAALQSFRLKKKPLTYLPVTDGAGLSAVRSTLIITVNGVRWDEVPILYDSAADARAYTVTQDDAGQTTVAFGDGAFGARPPSGKDNIRARYRKGLGTSGNVAADAIAQIIDGAPGLQRVTNPLPSFGGADPEGVDQIRTHAPASLRTFGRAVSAADYAALALSYPGVAKAGAAWLLRDPDTLAALPRPYIRLVVATADRVPLAQQATFARALRQFLNARRDPNVPLRLGDFTPVYIDVAVAVDVEDRSPREATLAGVRAALGPATDPGGAPGFFAFERLGFGQSIHLSAVYAVIQAVPGVRGALVQTLRRPDQDADPATVRDDLFLRPTELAVIANDPSDPTKGTLTVTWREGGFVDT
jgi:hypothetical protein